MIILTGATGKTGGEVAKQLAAHKMPFRVLVRDKDKAAALKDLGAEIAVGGMGDHDEVTKALAGVDTAVLIMSKGDHQAQSKPASNISSNFRRWSQSPAPPSRSRPCMWRPRNISVLRVSSGP